MTYLLVRRKLFLFQVEEPASGKRWSEIKRRRRDEVRERENFRLLRGVAGVYEVPGILLTRKSSLIHATMPFSGRSRSRKARRFG